MAKFYKNDNGVLQESEQVFFQDGTCLLISEYESYSYPINGWYYFNTEEEAGTFFNINLPTIDSLNKYANNA